MRRLWTWGPLLALSLTGGCASPLLHKPAPDFELPALDGGKLRLSQLRGKPVVLAFWAFG